MRPNALKKAADALLSVETKHRLKEAAQVVRYSAPDPLRPSVPLSPRAKGWLKTLRRDGIVRIETPELAELAAYLDRTYYQTLVRHGMPARLDGDALGRPGLFAKQRPVPQMEGLRASGLGREDQYLVSLKDPRIEALFLDPDIVGLFYNYYRRQPYYRNQPIVDHFSLEPGAYSPEDLNNFHVDHLRQMSGMLLLSELTTSTSRMQYLVGSHRRSLLRDRVYLDKRECEERVRRAPGSLCDLVGPPGTLYVFDASAVHRRHAVPGSTRKMFHWNVTPGHHLQKLEDELGDWPALDAGPAYVRKAFSGRRDSDRSGY